jgi:hypothetical protein
VASAAAIALYELGQAGVAVRGGRL